ncbi:MAG: DUF4352 domain-containing protein [Actinomycetota bacterium]
MASVQAPSVVTRAWFRKKRVILLLGLILLMVVLQVASGGGEPGAPDTAATASQRAAGGASATMTQIGVKVRDGSSEFVVTGVEHPGKTMAGKAGKTLTAIGEFVIVRVDITNLGTVPQAPDCSCQVLITDKRWGFEPSPSVLSTKEALKFVQRISPGETVKDVVVLFDLAPGTMVGSIELHDSQSSRGVRVNLS